MSNQQDGKKKDKDQEKTLPPDPETLHKTDPQDNMKGPISSLVHDVKEGVEKNDAESKEEANQKKEKTT